VHGVGRTGAEWQGEEFKAEIKTPMGNIEGDKPYAAEETDTQLTHLR